MSKLVDIRFLKQGLVRVEKPEHWDELTAREKIEWASGKLQEFLDGELLSAMADFPEAVKVLHENLPFNLSFFIEGIPRAESIENTEGIPLVMTNKWKEFINPDKTIIEPLDKM